MAFCQTDRTLPIQLSLCCPTLCRDSCFNGRKTFIKPQTFLNSKSVSQWAKCQSVSMQKKIGVSVINKNGTCLWTFFFFFFFSTRKSPQSQFVWDRLFTTRFPDKDLPPILSFGRSLLAVLPDWLPNTILYFCHFLCKETALASHHQHGTGTWTPAWFWKSTGEKPMLRISTAVGIF